MDDPMLAVGLFALFLSSAVAGYVLGWRHRGEHDAALRNVDRLETAARRLGSSDVQ